MCSNTKYSNLLQQIKQILLFLIQKPKNLQLPSFTITIIGNYQNFTKQEQSSSLKEDSITSPRVNLMLDPTLNS